MAAPVLPLPPGPAGLAAQYRGVRPQVKLLATLMILTALAGTC
ncbi:MAG: hypothetical protein U0903_21370 [Planctomycetales bacterium]